MNNLWQVAVGINATDVGIPNVQANDITFNNIVGIVYTIIAAAAVFFIILGAIQFVASGGDASKVKTARQSILFAVIGLAGSTLVFLIVNFIVRSV